MTRDTTPAENTQAAEPLKHAKPRRLGTWLSGGIVGFMLAALLLGGSVAFASSNNDGGGTSLRGTFVEKLAGHLGISTDELSSAVTLSANQTVDEAVASGQLTEKQGEALKKRIANGDIFQFRRPMRERVGHALFGCGEGMSDIASTLNMTDDELRQELESGKTLSEVITEHGSTVDAVVQSLVADASEQLNQAVADGKITQDQADKILAELPERLTNMIEHGIPGPHHHGMPNDNDTPGTTATPQGSTGA